MRYPLGPIYDVDCVEYAKLDGAPPTDANDVARLFANRLTRCLLSDPEGFQRVFLHAVTFKTEKLKTAGIRQLDESERISFNTLLTSIAGSNTKEDGSVEMRLITLMRYEPGKEPAVTMFAALEDVRDTVEMLNEQEKERQKSRS